MDNDLAQNAPTGEEKMAVAMLGLASDLTRTAEFIIRKSNGSRSVAMISSLSRCSGVHGSLTGPYGSG